MAKSSAPYEPPPTKSTPDLKKDFYKARRPEFPPAAEARGPVSRAQIEALKALPQEKFTAPVKVNALEPKNINRIAPKAPPTRATQIDRMESRLKQTKGVAKDRFQRAAPSRER